MKIWIRAAVIQILERRNMTSRREKEKAIKEFRLFYECNDDLLYVDDNNRIFNKNGKWEELIHVPDDRIVLWYQDIPVQASRLKDCCFSRKWFREYSKISSDIIRLIKPNDVQLSRKNRNGHNRKTAMYKDKRRIHTFRSSDCDVILVK